MSAFPDHPTHLLDWLRTRTEYAELPEAELRGTFIPRRVYGDYLRSVALPYKRPVDPHAQVEIESVNAEAVEIGDEGNAVVLADGKKIAADKIVLALGNQPPAELPGAETVADHAGVLRKPVVGRLAGSVA